MDSSPRTPGNPVPAAPSWWALWPDLLAFAGGLLLAWCFHWQVRDLVWSLWLSSLTVGYAMIVWAIVRPLVAAEAATSESVADPAKRTLLQGAWLVGALFTLGFFTVHFGMFHFVHSVFLNQFFPAVDGPARGFPGFGVYWHVATTYWPFVLLAAVAERDRFRTTSAFVPLRGLRDGGKSGDPFAAPYKNVVRMHLMIFFFAFTSFAKLENFSVYAVVYAVYFFPWRRVKPAITRPAAAA